MSGGDNTPYRAAIFTAIQTEYEAVRAHLTNLREDEIELEPSCERGEFLANNRKWDVLVVEMGAGTTQAAAKTTYIIDRFHPQVVIFVGIAGGIKDVKPGDVVVASRVYSYESGRADPDFRARSHSYLPTPQILRRARAVARKRDWLERLKEELFSSKEVPNVFVAPVASGNLVVASINAVVLQLVRSHFNDAAAIEMEGFGFLESARLYREIESLIIRGISDLIEDKSDTDQPLAAKRASAFAFEVLATLKIKKPLPPLTGSKEATPSPLLMEFNESLPDYIDNVKKIRDPLHQRTGFSNEQHKNAMKGLNDAEKHIEKLLGARPSILSTAKKAVLAAMQECIHDLKPELEWCSDHSQVIKPSQSGRVKNARYDRAVKLYDKLLEGLEQWLR